MVKCFIFDQDGTLYPRNHLLMLTLRKKTKSWLMSGLHKSKKEVSLLYKWLMQNYPNPFDGFTSLGCSIEDYHNSVFNSVDPKKYLTKDGKLIKLFKKISFNFSVYIVTFASPLYSKRVQRALGIYPFIKETYYVKDNPVDHSKEFFYRLIAKNEKLKFNEICVVGDEYYIDILPAKKLGCISVYVSSKKIKGPNFTIKSIYNLPNIFK